MATPQILVELYRLVGCGNELYGEIYGRSMPYSPSSLRISAHWTFVNGKW
jgi:hypothetical protein